MNSQQKSGEAAQPERSAAPGSQQEVANYFANLASGKKGFAVRQTTNRAKGYATNLSPLSSSTAEIEEEARSLQALSEGLRRNDPQATSEALRYLTEVRTQNGRELNRVGQELQKTLPDDATYLAEKEKVQQFDGALQVLRQNANLPVAEEALQYSREAAKQQQASTPRGQLESTYAVTQKSWQETDQFIKKLGGN